MKLSLLLIPLLFLSSCNGNQSKNTVKNENTNQPLAASGEVYNKLLETCTLLKKEEQEGCTKSVEHMKKYNFPEALKNEDGTSYCDMKSKNTKIQSFMLPGSKTWCIE